MITREELQAMTVAANERRALDEKEAGRKFAERLLKASPQAAREGRDVCGIIVEMHERRAADIAIEILNSRGHVASIQPQIRASDGGQCLSLSLTWEADEPR